MTRVRLDLEPRLLSREQAAGYCGVSVPTFEAECPVIPVRIRTRVLYDRAAIDRWLDTLTEKTPELGSSEYWRGRLDDAYEDQGH